jgi:hypothetical protein
MDDAAAAGPAFGYRDRFTVGPPGRLPKPEMKFGAEPAP